MFVTLKNRGGRIHVELDFKSSARRSHVDSLFGGNKTDLLVIKACTKVYDRWQYKY